MHLETSGGADVINVDICPAACTETPPKSAAEAASVDARSPGCASRAGVQGDQ